MANHFAVCGRVISLKAFYPRELLRLLQGRVVDEKIPFTSFKFSYKSNMLSLISSSCFDFTKILL
jgi:hypothetical protein